MLGTLLFASSAWFLHFARLGTQDILYVLPVVSVAATVWLQNSKGSAPAVLTSAAIVITLLYIPGMIWFVVPAVLWQIGRIGRMLEGQKVAFLTILTLLVVLALTPIGWAFYQHHELVRTYFGVPAALPQPVEFIKNVLNVPLQLFWKGPNNPEIWLARLPLLDWFSMAMLVIGTYALFKRRKLDRTWFIVFMVVIGSVLASVGGPVKLTIILPFVYLLVAGGIAQMLRQWFSVFPRNPFARSTGAILMTVAILMSAYYNVSHYFIAWPNTEETQKVFHNKP